MKQLKEAISMQKNAQNEPIKIDIQMAQRVNTEIAQIYASIDA